MKKILTISIAAYNVAKFLPQIFENLICSNRLEEIEVLVINDGSTDNTSAVAKRYAEQYPNSIRVIDKKNGGHGSTINCGIAEAKGIYFKALDGDDWLDGKELASLIDSLKECKSDLVVCNHRIVYENNGIAQEVKISLQPDIEFILEDVILQINRLQYYDVYFKTILLKNYKIKITEFSFYTDNELVMYPLAYINTITRFDNTPYCYRIGVEGQSVSIKGFQKHEKEHFNILNKIMEFYTTNSNLWEERRNIKRFYEELLCRMAEIQTWIYFTYPASMVKMREVIEFDNYMKSRPTLYQKMKGKKIKLWRINRTLFYLPIRLIIKFKYSEYGEMG